MRSCWSAGSLVGWSLFRFSLDSGAPPFGGSVLVRSYCFLLGSNGFQAHLGKRLGVVFWLAPRGIPVLFSTALVSLCLLLQLVALATPVFVFCFLFFFGFWKIKKSVVLFRLK